MGAAAAVTSRTASGLAVTTRPAIEAPPTGPAGRVVLVHGAMDRATSFGRVGLRLREAEVVTYDRRGYAGSWSLGPTPDFAHQVHDLVEVLDGRPAIVAGHSFGGNVVLATAAAHPELIPAAVIFEAPAPWEHWWRSTTQRESAGRSPEDTAEAFMIRMVGRRIWERLPDATRRQRRAEGATMLAELRALGRDRPYEPEAVTCPVVVGWGTSSPDHLRMAAATLAGELPRGVAVEVVGSNHGVHLSHPEALADMVRRAVAAAG